MEQLLNVTTKTDDVRFCVTMCCMFCFARHDTSSRPKSSCLVGR